MRKETVQAHFTYNLANATVRHYPFPHLYYENVFPDNFYTSLIKSMPEFPSYSPMSKVRPVFRSDGKPAYPDRFVITLNHKMKSIGPHWDILQKVLDSQPTHMTLLSKFRNIIQPRIGDDAVLEPDAILIRDRTNYTLGPHTDNPKRLAVLIIYLPETNENPHLGTSLYVPNSPGQICPGGPHYNHEDFTCVFTAPYKPNSAIAFVKTDNSFHGVEPVLEGEERNLIHFFSKFANG